MRIELGRGYEAEIDFSDHWRTIGYNWYAMVTHTNVYAYATVDKRTLLMHRHILQPPDGMEVDHVDNDGLNNRQSNLRVATRSQNMTNKEYAVGVSGYRGVSANGSGWKARINQNGKEISLGTFDTAEEPARAYDTAAKELHGAFAQLNFPWAG